MAALLAGAGHLLVGRSVEFGEFDEVLTLVIGVLDREVLVIGGVGGVVLWLTDGGIPDGVTHVGLGGHLDILDYGYRCGCCSGWVH